MSKDETEIEFDDGPHAPELPTPADELLEGRQVFSMYAGISESVAIRSDGELGDFPMYEFEPGRYVLVKLPDEDDEAGDGDG